MNIGWAFPGDENALIQQAEPSRGLWSTIKGYATGGMVAPRGFALGGGIFGTDTVPAMLTPGEFVMTKSAVERIGSSTLNAMNNGTSGGDSVYNYSITLNVSSTSDANEIADAVLKEVKRVDSQRIRSNF
jgi:hypothetical protein